MKEFKFGDKILFGKEVRTMVGVNGNCFVFANLNPQDHEETIIHLYEDSEIEELMESGYIKIVNNKLNLKKELTKIAIDNNLVKESLDTRNLDELDFMDCSVWSIKKALNEAFELGKKNVGGK